MMLSAASAALFCADSSRGCSWLAAAI